MRKFYQEHKREILVGVIVSLLTTGVIKLGDWFIDFVPTVGISFFQVLSNIVFTRAANCSDNIVTESILFILAGVMGGVILSIILEGIRSYKKSLSLEKIVRMSPDELEAFFKRPAKRRKSQEREEDDLSKLIDSRKKLGKSMAVLVCALVLLYINLTLFVSRPMQLYNTFQRDIVKIAPYIQENQIIKLKSDWVCMRTKSDYDAVYMIISSVVDNHALPK